MQENRIFMPEEHMDALYNSKNPLVRFVQNNRLKEIVKAIPAKRGLKILDAGCGEGHLIERLNQKYSRNSYVGFDITDVALEQAKERCPFAEFHKMDIRATSFNDESFDIVICTEVLEHVTNYRPAIEELKRVLRKDGFLIITFPNEFLWTISRILLGRKPFKVPDHFNSFNPKLMREMVEITLVGTQNLPLGLPFFLSLVCLMKFKK